VTDDEQISAYLHEVRSSLRVPRKQRRRVLEEIESHLHDGAAEHMRSGATRSESIAWVIDELGPPDVVGSAFADQALLVPTRTGAVRWLPIVLPLALLVEALGLVVWSITWLADGWTVGERTVLWGYLRTAAFAGLLVFATAFCIRRGDHDRAWRWAAWACTGCAVLFVVTW
jgi:hypothetical protein